MKTNQEIRAEALQLAVIAGQYQREQRVAIPGRQPAEASRVLATIPAATATKGSERQVEAAIVFGALEFRLTERKENNHAGQQERLEDSATIVTSASPYEILHEGYELAEEERLAVALEPYADRSEERTDPADENTVAEVEAVLETSLLPAADRMRTKAEVVEFLEGRLKPSVFIARAVERHFSRDDGHRHQLVERRELKLTIDET